MCVLFEHEGFQGDHITLLGSSNDLHRDGWGDKLSSVIVHSGFFTFYEDIGFQSRNWHPVKLGAGYYADSRQHRIPNDQASSVQASTT
jgi:hypothetical protein